MQNYNYGGMGYRKYLELKRAAAKALQEVRQKPLPVHERIDSWFNGLSDDDKHRAWTMREFRALFGETPQKIGAALFELGWTRKRMWRDDRQTSRYWLKK